MKVSELFWSYNIVIVVLEWNFSSPFEAHTACGTLTLNAGSCDILSLSRSLSLSRYQVYSDSYLPFIRRKKLWISSFVISKNLFSVFRNQTSFFSATEWIKFEARFVQAMPVPKRTPACFFLSFFLSGNGSSNTLIISNATTNSHPF